MAFHDDVYVVTLPHRVAHSFSVVQEQLRRHSNIRVRLGKITVWNACGVEPRACQILQRIADASGNRESVWKGSGLPTELQGIKVLGTRLGHPDFVAAQLDRVLSDHRTLLERIPAVQDVLCSFTVQVAGPTAKSESSDRGTHGGFCHGARRRVVAMHVRDSPGAFGHRSPRQRHCFLAAGAGRVGLRSAVRSRQSAHWASWADTLPMVTLADGARVGRFPGRAPLP